MLITNSDYHYTNKMMSFAYNRFMPPGSTWRDLFDMVGVFYNYVTKVLHDGRPSALIANAAVLYVCVGALLEIEQKFNQQQYMQEHPCAIGVCCL